MCEHNSTKNADHYSCEMTEETVKVLDLSERGRIYVYHSRQAMRLVFDKIKYFLMKLFSVDKLVQTAEIEFSQFLSKTGDIARLLRVDLVF